METLDIKNENALHWEERVTCKEIDNLPAVITPKEINKALLHISELKLYELLNRKGCPKLEIGRKYLLPTRKFIEWLEHQAVGV